MALLFAWPAFAGTIFAQRLKLKPRGAAALTGSEFAAVISDTSLSQAERERLIFRQFKTGNVPDFLRKLVKITDTAKVDGRAVEVTYYATPDYLAIGSSRDYFYCPMTPMLAQRIASLAGCSLPTAKMVDKIYREATVKLVPQPIPPSEAMTTVPVFLQHNRMVQEQRKTKGGNPGELTAGHKKDIVISSKIYSAGKPRVVIYGWHKPDGKPIQPLYNGHSPEWADYSHGVRLISNTVSVNGREMRLQKILKSPELHSLLSCEGLIATPYYPRTHDTKPGTGP